jgi:hypothetical protein
MTHSPEPFVLDDGKWVRPNTIFNWRTGEQAVMSEQSIRKMPSVRFGWTCVLVALCLESNGKRKIKMRVQAIRGGWTANELDDKVNIQAWVWANEFPNLVNWGHLSFPVYPQLDNEQEELLLKRLEKLIDLDEYWNKDEFQYRPDATD